MSNKEVTFTVTGQELEQIFQFVIKRPIEEAIGVYSLILEISKRNGGQELPLPSPEVETAEEVEEVEKAKTR